MKWLLGLLFLIYPTMSEAAYTSVLWDWSIGSGGEVSGFHVKCGRSATNYTITLTVNDPSARSVSIYAATNNQRGQWYCTVDAFHATNGTSNNGNEVNFVLPFNDPSEGRGRGGSGFGFGF